MSYRCETFRDCGTTILLSSLKVSDLYTSPCGFYRSSNVQNRMCELCTFSQIQSQIRNSIFQSVISQECLKLQTCNLLWMYTYIIATRLPTPQCTVSWFSYHFRFFINTTSTYKEVDGGEVGSHKVASFSNTQQFLGEMA